MDEIVKVQDISFAQVQKWVARARSDELDQLVAAVVRAYDSMNPTWEGIFMKVHRDPLQRRKDIEEILLRYAPEM